MGPEFISRALDHCAYINRVTLDFSTPEERTENAVTNPSMICLGTNA